MHGTIFITISVHQFWKIDHFLSEFAEFFEKQIKVFAWYHFYCNFCVLSLKDWPFSKWICGIFKKQTRYLYGNIFKTISVYWFWKLVHETIYIFEMDIFCLYYIGSGSRVENHWPFSNFSDDARKLIIFKGGFE